MAQNFNFQGNFDLQKDFSSDVFNKFGNLGGDMSPEQWAAFSGFAFLGGWYIALMTLAVIAVYILFAWSFMKISQKTKIGNPWFAWVPVLNVILWLNIGGFSGWYIFVFLLALIPLVGWLAVILFSVYVWMNVSKACKKPDYLGLLSLIPAGMLILPLYLAFAKK